MPNPPGSAPGGGSPGGAGPGPGEGDQQERQTQPSAPAGSVHITEEIDWRSRAIAAEAQVQQLESQLADIKSTLTHARQQLDASERRASVERELASAGVIDPETATLLIERAMEGMDPPDIALAIADLKRRKPFLFRPAPGAGQPRASAMSSASQETEHSLDALAAQARDSGDRKLLMKYLSARRRK